MPDLPPGAERLFRVAPEEFVAERARLARELRAAGRREAAAQVAALRKPTAAAWAVNRVAGREPGLMGKLVQCAANLRRAHERGGEELRRATATYRDIVREVAAAARQEGAGGRPLSDPLADRVRATLLAAAADPGLAEEIRAGRLTAERTGAVLPGVAAPALHPPSGATKAPGAARAPSRSKRPPDAAAAPSGAQRPPRASPAPSGGKRAATGGKRLRRDHERRLEAAQRRLAERRNAAAAASAAAGAARARLAGAEEATARARAALDDAEAAVSRARKTLQGAQDAAEGARAAADEAQAAVERLLSEPDQPG